jgi:hypothetical protein
MQIHHGNLFSKNKKMHERELAYLLEQIEWWSLVFSKTNIVLSLMFINFIIQKLSALLVIGKNQHKKLWQGENTLWWTLLGGHIILLYKGVHVWMYLASKLWNIFTIFLHNMLEYNPCKRLEKKLFHFIFKDGRLEYTCENKCNVLVYSKAQIYS